MVIEFTKLQGTMGMEYACRQGEDEEVARAIYEHYLPRGADDIIPSGKIGAVLALADRIDSVAAFISAGIKPSGSGDPYGLRRHAQGVIRILAEHQMPLRLDLIGKAAVSALPPSRRIKEPLSGFLEFFRQRIESFLDTQGGETDINRAAMKTSWYDISDLFLRIRVLNEMSGKKELMAATTIVERTGNIITAAGCEDERAINEGLLQEPAERDLFSVFSENAGEIERLFREQNYREATARYARVLSAPLHHFFEEVMVNVSDERIRSNRLALLGDINRFFVRNFADLSLLQFERGEYVI